MAKFMIQAETVTDVQLAELAEQVAHHLKSEGIFLVTAESCTGGWLAKLLTDVIGSSHWFERGFVTYSNESKQELLGVEAATIQEQGAVSEATVRAMARGALKHSHARISVAISGIAGPGGASADKPVGTVWFAWGYRDGGRPTGEIRVNSHSCLFDGDRDRVRRQAVAHAMQVLLELIPQVGGQGHGNTGH
ncbi:MAG: nicotinamide-nucleotide amidase [Thioalkalispiraceae bacterium]|jgi:nicotinamide-nucleotide amidase